MTIDKRALFSRLAEGNAAGVTVVTPNRRLSQALVSEFDSHQRKKEKSTWEAPDILPMGAFIERLYGEALYSCREAEPPLLLSAAQEQQLWRQVIEKAGLLVVDGAAAACRDAWHLAHAWRIQPGRGNEDAQAFAAWSDAYLKKSAGSLDPARLPDWVAGKLKALKRPKLLVAYAFDILPPQTREFFDACAAAGIEVARCQPERRQGATARTSFSSKREELEKAAAWARARLEESRGRGPILPSALPRIGVVVPELQQRRREVARVFARVFRPGFNLPGAAKVPMPFNLSLGLPLTEYPIVALALSLLRFSGEELSFEEASRLLRSPFIAGAEKEMSQRALLDARLRRMLGATLSLPKLIGALESAPLLRDLLERVFALAKELPSRTASASQWARHFSALLEAAGFPGERTLDSHEHQALAKWHELLGEVSGLERMCSALSFSQAIDIVRARCADTLFQPESAEAPVQVLGVLESAGLEFDCLWVSGLTDEAWPLDAAPNPFLPVAAQQAAGIPQASAESSLALDRRITEGWRMAADEVVFSSFEKEEDRELSPSPLISHIAPGSLGIPRFARLRDAIFSAGALSSRADSSAPALAPERRAVRGGTRVLSDQAACPFRAFARWRLHAQALEAPAEGLDAAARGRLLHALMSFLWKDLKNSRSLEQDLSSSIAAASAAAVKELALEGLVSPRFAELERARLARLAREWLGVEKTRKPFEVVALEKPIALRLGTLELAGRIDRLDRIAGGHALIDYKTSRAPSPKHWEPPRPDDAQLPIYAVASEEPIAALAFAKLRPGQMKFMGFSREGDALPGVKPAKNWQALLKDWRTEAESLAGSFAGGEARVDPKRGLATCRYCDLQTLCRVHEKLSALRDEPVREDDA